MSMRKTRNPELAQAVDSLGDAAQHVRRAVRGKIDEIRATAAAELVKAKAVALKKTGVVQGKVEAVLNRAEARLHRLIAKAQKSLDTAVRLAERRSAASAPKAPARARAEKAAARPRTRKSAPRKAVVTKPKAPAGTSRLRKTAG